MDAVWLHWLCDYIGSLFCNSNKSWQDGTVCLVLYRIYAVEWSVYTANNIAYSALTSLVTKNSKERVQMGSYRFILLFQPVF